MTLDFRNLDGTFIEPDSRYDWKKSSRAVIAAGRHSGCVLWYVGGHLNQEIEETGLHRLDELGLDDAPEGISIWEGTYIWEPGPWEYPMDGETHPKGTFRDPTSTEWEAIKRNECPWNAEEWMVNK